MLRGRRLRGRLLAVLPDGLTRVALTGTGGELSALTGLAIPIATLNERDRPARAASADCLKRGPDNSGLFVCGIWCPGAESNVVISSEFNCGSGQSALKIPAFIPSPTVTRKFPPRHIFVSSAPEDVQKALFTVPHRMQNAHNFVIIRLSINEVEGCER